MGKTMDVRKSFISIILYVNWRIVRYFTSDNLPMRELFHLGFGEAAADKVEDYDWGN